MQNNVLNVEYIGYADLNGTVNMKELKEKFKKIYNESKDWLIDNSKFKKGDLVLFKQRFLDTIGIGKIVHIEANPVYWERQYEIGEINQNAEIPHDKHHCFNIPEEDIITKVTI